MQRFTLDSNSQEHTFQTQLKPGSLVPVSRGASCTINGLAQASLPTNTTEITLSLPHPTALSRLVTRGLQVEGLSARRIVVEVSSDGVSWTRVFAQDSAPPTVVKDLGDGAGLELPSSPISQVRLRTEPPDSTQNTTFIAALNQLSVFAKK